MLLITFMAHSLVDPFAVKDAWKSPGLRAALIIVLTVVAYIPAMRGGFIWDDDIYITDNPMVKGSDGLYRFWFTTEAPDYYPLTSTLWWLEWRFWGNHATGYHVVNVLLHAANAVLVWLILRRLKIPGAWVAGLVFALHPVNVATVAWISELKNTLSMLFYAGAILLYLRFDEEGRWRWYGFSLAAFLLALLSKTAVVMLPVVLLGCIWWLRGRVRWKDFVHSVPFFVLSLVLGLVSVWVENWTNRQIIVRATGFFSRLAGAGWATWFYLYKALLPFDLTVVYPQWQIDVSHWVSYVPGMLLAGCFGLFWWKRQTWGRPLLFGLAYFVMALFPVLGFFDIGFFLYSLVADHWQYHAIVGAIALAVVAGELICRRMSDRTQDVAVLASVAVLMVLGVSTWRRACVYADSETLWRDTVERNPNAWVAHYNLGNDLLRVGRVQDAIEHYELAVRLKPDYVEAHNELAFALLQAGKVNDAIAHLEQTVRINPDSVVGHYNLANALVQAGRVEDAIGHYEQAVRLRPDFAEAHHGFGVLLARAGRPKNAIDEFSKALQFRPDYPEAHQNLGAMLANEGKTNEAIAHVASALRLYPDYPEAHYTLAILLAKQGKLEEAISHLQSALKLEPNSEKYRRAFEALQRVITQPESR